MAFAILQKELVVPDVEQLKRAFAVLPTLTSFDAQTAANDAYGIVLRGLDAEQAGKLQAALMHEQLDTEVVLESKLPVIPPAKVARQVEFHPSHLTLYDSMRRASAVPWSDIMFIAAGYVRMREVRKQRGNPEEPSMHGAGIAMDLATGTKSREEEHDHMLLEVFLGDGTTRYSIVADDFVFDHLGTRLSDDLSINFVFLVQDLAEQAPQAGLNRGAYMACQRPPELFPYPSRAAFNEEITWMLWRIGRMSESSAANKAVG